MREADVIVPCCHMGADPVSDLTSLLGVGLDDPYGSFPTWDIPWFISGAQQTTP